MLPPFWAIKAKRYGKVLFDRFLDAETMLQPFSCQNSDRTCCALFLRCAAISKVSATRWACLRSLRRVDLSINRPSLSRKKACQNFEAGLLWMLAVSWLFGGFQRTFKTHTALKTLMLLHRFPPSSFSLILRRLRSI